MDKKAIGKAIKKYRQQCGITQKQLADMIGKSLSTIQKYESGDVEAPLSVLEQISYCLRLEVYELLEADASFDLFSFTAKPDEPLFEYWKALGYVFKDHPLKPDDLLLLVHYGYSYDIPINQWLLLIDSFNVEAKSLLEKLIDKYSDTRKLYKEE